MVLLASCVLSLLGAASDLFAGQASAQVEEAVKQVIEIMKQPELKAEGREAERRRKIRAALAPQFDFYLMSRLSLGKQWRKLSEAQRSEFVEVFGRLIENTYMSSIEKYSNEKVVVDREKARGKSKVVVETRVVTSSKEIPIHYSMVSKGGKWAVYDVKIEGVGLVKNYRTQFGSFLRKKSHAELMQQLREKTEDGDEE